MDAGKTYKVLDDMALGDTSYVRLIPAGTWESATDARRTAIGHTMELLQDLSPVTLPIGPIQVGDRWPVTQLFQRRAVYGQITVTFVGEATLDSVVGTRAWMTLSGQDTGQVFEHPLQRTSRSVISWDLASGGLLSSTTEEATVLYDGGTPPRPGARLTSRRVVTRLPQTEDNPQVVP
jgi:hypothetical protein